MNDPAPFVEGMEALCQPESADTSKDLTLCSICLQWTCDGPHCHRDFCPDEKTAATK